MKPANLEDMNWDTTISIPDAATFDDIEIQPVRMDEDEQGQFCEVCDPEDANFWSVYVTGQTAAVSV